MENLHIGLDELTNLTAPLANSDGRKKHPLSSQLLGPNATHGLCLASQRGLEHLVRDYMTGLLHFEKEQNRLSQVARDLLPGTSEDVDLECRYERLPLSPLLTSATTRSLKDLLKPGVREELWRLLSTYRGACAEVLTKPEDSDDDDTTTGTAQCRSSDGRLLTKHEEILGGVYVLLDASDLLDTNLGKRARTRGQVRQHEVDRFRLLTIFAAAAFVTLTEKWFNCLLYTSPSPRDQRGSGMPASA